MAKKNVRSAASKLGRGRSKRERVATIPFLSRIRVDQARQLEAITDETGVPRTKLLEEAIAQYLAARRASTKQADS